MRKKGETWNKGMVSHNCCLVLLALLQASAPSSALNTAGYLERPVDVAVASSGSVVFRCGVPAAAPNLTFTVYGSKSTYNLTCPNANVVTVSQTLCGHCEIKNGESVAIWNLSHTSMSDNGTQVVCRQPNNPEAPSAILYVYTVSTSYAIFAGCIVGGFFGTFLVFALLYILLRRSEGVRQCFRGKHTEDDLSTIVTTEPGQ